jgi:hypothetical protein
MMRALMAPALFLLAEALSLTEKQQQSNAIVRRQPLGIQDRPTEVMPENPNFKRALDGLTRALELPKHWTVHTSRGGKNEGKKFFYNSVTGKAQWRDPRDDDFDKKKPQQTLKLAEKKPPKEEQQKKVLSAKTSKKVYDSPPEGTYRDSCDPCTVSAQVLSCTCTGGPDPAKESNLDLMRCVSPLEILNDNGRLACAHDDETFVTEDLIIARPEDWKTAFLKAAPSADTIVNKFRACKITKMQKFDHLCHLFVMPEAKTMQMHIYKNAGSTLEDTHRDKGGDGFQHGMNHSQKELGEMINDESWFRTALVRDPMDRAISSFHEIKARSSDRELYAAQYPEGGKRATDYAAAGYHDGCESPESALEDFQKMMDYTEHDDSPVNHVPFGWHFLTQTHFMIDAKGEKFPLDYIGQFKDLLREEKYLMKDENLELVYNSGPYDSNQPGCRIDKTKLSVDIQRSICRAFQDDYCCFGFDFPEACSDMKCPTD